MGLKNLNQIELVSKIPIPPEIMEHFRSNFHFKVVKMTEYGIYCFCLFVFYCYRYQMSLYDGVIFGNWSGLVDN